VDSTLHEDFNAYLLCNLFEFKLIIGYSFYCEKRMVLRAHPIYYLFESRYGN